MSQFIVMARDYSLLAPVEVIRQVTSAVLPVVEHLAAEVAYEHDFAISVDCDMSLRLLPGVADNTDVVIGLERATVSVEAHLHLVPVHRLGEVVSSVRVERVTPVGNVATPIHHVVPVPQTVRLANTTEVDVVHLSLAGHPDIVKILERYPGTLRNGALVLASPLRFSSDGLQPLFERRNDSVEVGLCPLEFLLLTLVVITSSVVCTLGVVEL